MNLILTAVLGLLAGFTVYGLDCLRRTLTTVGQPPVPWWVGAGVLTACLLTWAWSAAFGMDTTRLSTPSEQLLGAVWIGSIMVGGAAGARWHFVLTRRERRRSQSR